MSYTSIVKNEVSKLDMVETENISELSAIIRNIGQIGENIKISSENASVSRRIFTLIKKIYHFNPKIVVRRGYNFNKNYIYIIEVNQKIDLIKRDLSLDQEIPKEYIYADEFLIRAYLRGLFLSSGSINDPKKSRYHLEFIVDSYEYAKYINTMLNEYSLNSRIIRREKNYMVYIKEAEKISDFLRIIKAYNGVMYFEDIRIYRDHKNMTNRLNNCEQANMDKVFLTSSNQIKDIDKLKELGLYDELDSKLKKVIDYRLKYPESSLQELSDIISLETGVKITKSGLNHRFRKIKEIVSNLEKKENEK